MEGVEVEGVEVEGVVVEGVVVEGVVVEGEGVEVEGVFFLGRGLVEVTVFGGFGTLKRVGTAFQISLFLSIAFRN